MPGSTPPTSQLDWLIATTAMIVLFWSRATRDLLKSFGWGIAALHRLDAATKLPFPRRPPHSISRSPLRGTAVRTAPFRPLGTAAPLAVSDREKDHRHGVVGGFPGPASCASRSEHAKF